MGKSFNLGPLACKRGVGLWHIGVFCAKSVGSRLTTSSFIVKEQGRCGVVPRFFWSFLGLSLFG